VKIVVAVLLGFSLNCEAQNFFGGGSISRRGNSENVRWTLGDWMSQKQKIRLMDQWLAVNRQSQMFELNFEGGQSQYDLTIGGTRTSQDVTRFSGQLWISIFGLQYIKEESDEDWESQSYQFNIRLLGQSTQSTNLTAFYGVRTWDDANPIYDYENQFAGARLNLYIVSFFGIEGLYRKDLSATDSSQREVEGERTEYGVFFDLSFVRIYGNAFVDKTTITTAGVPQIVKRDGFDAGFRIYF